MAARMQEALALSACRICNAARRAAGFVTLPYRTVIRTLLLLPRGETNMACPHCGAPDEATVSRGGLVAHCDPFRVDDRGRRLDLSPAQAEILYKLVRFGRVPFDMLQSGRSYESMRVLVHSLRRKLPQGVEIEAVRGWGYVLQIQTQPRRAEQAELKAMAPAD